MKYVTAFKQWFQLHTHINNSSVILSQAYGLKLKSWLCLLNVNKCHGFDSIRGGISYIVIAGTSRAMT